MTSKLLNTIFSFPEILEHATDGSPYVAVDWATFFQLPDEVVGRMLDEQSLLTDLEARDTGLLRGKYG